MSDRSNRHDQGGHGPAVERDLQLLTLTGLSIMLELVGTLAMSVRGQQHMLILAHTILGEALEQRESACPECDKRVREIALGELRRATDDAKKRASDDLAAILRGRT